MPPILIVIMFTVFWVVFAIIKEIVDQKDAYSASKSRDKDNISSALRKIRYCMSYETRTVKWRRSVIAASIATIALFSVCWRRIPTSEEILSHLLIITMVYSLIWDNFCFVTGSSAVRYCDGNIEHIKKLLVKNHTFVLPSW